MFCDLQVPSGSCIDVMLGKSRLTPHLQQRSIKVKSADEVKLALSKLRRDLGNPTAVLGAGSADHFTLPMEDPVHHGLLKRFLPFQHQSIYTRAKEVYDHGDKKKTIKGYLYELPRTIISLFCECYCN